MGVVPTEEAQTIETEETTETTEESGQESEIEQTEEDQPEATEETPEETKEEYVPDFTYKFKDQEFEFDERFKGIIKTKEDEQYVRDLLTAEKAHAAYKEFGGIREIEEKFTNYEQTATEHKQLNQEIDQLSGMLALNSSAGFEAFRKHLDIPKEQILQWAIEEAKAQQDPEAAQSIMTQRQIEEQNFNLQYQNSMLQNSREAEIVNQRQAELDSLLGSNEVSKAYDDLVGTPGSFKQAVIEHGANVYYASNGQTILSVPEAVKAIEQRFQGLIANQVSGTNNQVAQNPKQNTTSNDPEKTVVIRQEGKTTLPNVGGGNGSPAKKKITSLDEMRKAAKAMD